MRSWQGAGRRPCRRLEPRTGSERNWSPKRNKNQGKVRDQAFPFLYILSDENMNMGNAIDLQLIRFDRICIRHVSIHASCLECPSRPHLTPESPKNCDRGEEEDEATQLLDVIDKGHAVLVRGRVQPMTSVRLLFPIPNGILNIKGVSHANMFTNVVQFN